MENNNDDLIKRSNQDDLIKRSPEELNNDNIHPQVKYLLNLPYYVQRSQSWFNERENKLTASDLDTVLGRNKYSEPIDVLFKKCGIAEPFIGNKATAHGQKYEDDAIDLYCALYNKKNSNFGLLPHPKVSFLAGSPDGITHDGIVIEVKCPYSREIKIGEIPHHYLSQVYINMEVCELDDAVFIEYKPSPKVMDENENFKDIDDLHSGNYILNVVHVKRDPNWFSSIYPKLEKVWDEIQYYRKIGIDKHPDYEYMIRKTRIPTKLSLVNNYIIIQEEDKLEIEEEKINKYEIIDEDE